ncbi:ATP-dependent 6-phosphofructokinase [Kiritimatiellota bacterium B12222]|nr:ATP-dependent 6-phosphofructokinase [Kiritimatiellota bacterium B12222]
MNTEQTTFDFNVDKLGPCNVPSPLKLKTHQYIREEHRTLVNSDLSTLLNSDGDLSSLPSMETAGPHAKIFHPHFLSRVAIVTCGGLCPGLNSVIKGIVETLTQEYGVREIYGIPYGYAGLADPQSHPPQILDADGVDTIHMEGGSILGTSRGSQDVKRMVQNLSSMRINMLFAIGGDGTLKGASHISEEIKKQKLEISVVGVPKTIDNDIQFVGNSFGFETAVYQSTPVITAAHVEARSVYNGLGIVKLMGRDSGFISAYATLANPVVNFCLVPEDSWQLDGENGLLKAVERRFRRKSHAVIIVAEGAGQHLFQDLPDNRDASGNLLKQDIGAFLCEKFKDYFSEKKIPTSLKYFDPSYSIRSIPASGTDQIQCHRLAENAVHAAMAGKTNMVIGYWNETFVNVPIPAATYARKKIDTDGTLWRSVMACTGQAKYFDPSLKA